MWEQLKAPVVPMLTYGAFELFPKSKFDGLFVRMICRAYMRIMLPMYDCRELGQPCR
jgi:hypothetical protein